jgi:hypothetical protein
MPKIVSLVHLHNRHLRGIRNHIPHQFYKPLYDYINSVFLSYLEINQDVCHTNSPFELSCVQ